MILALNGGGMRGGLQVGALSELSKRAKEPAIHKLFLGGVYGISVGAIVGTYVAFGFSMDEIEDIIAGWSEVPLAPPDLRSVLNFSEVRGLDDGSVIRQRLCDDFSKHGMKFGDLRIKDALIPLHIVASDCVNARTVVFGENVHVWDAVRSSTSIPYVYVPHSFGGGTFVDGAIMCSNILEVIPVDVRKEVLFLLITRSVPIKPENFMETVNSLKSIRACRKIYEAYPKMTCLLIDDETPTINVWSSKETATATVERGAACFRQFDFVFEPSAETKNCSYVDVRGGPEYS